MKTFFAYVAWYACMAVLGLFVGVLAGCGGGAGAMPFGPVTQESATTEEAGASAPTDGKATTLPVTCAPERCAK